MSFQDQGIHGDTNALIYHVSSFCILHFQELLSESRWQQLVEQFRQENFKLYQLNPHSVFSVALQAGMSALKTPHCYKEGDQASKNPDCPICTRHINKLARGLPFAHCANSRLICRISGQALNEHNPPMMLPNGYVYGLNVSVTCGCIKRVKCRIKIYEMQYKLYEF